MAGPRPGRHAPALGRIEAFHLREDGAALSLQASRLVFLGPAVRLVEEQGLLIALPLLCLVALERRLLHRAEIIVIENAIELGEINVGDAAIAADQEHVFVIVVGRWRSK